MGMYTELVLSTQVKDIPEVIAAIKHIAGKEKCDKLPDHPFFKLDGFNVIMTCASYYFVPIAVCVFQYDDISKNWSLISSANFKNYENEIQLFCDWINPYLDCEEGEMFGYSRYEEDDDPIILRKQEAKGDRDV